ncbi:hypothetical protein B0537_06910 [Desulforamulus ferrireducens]|uniref:Uncharacterized protein n=1 Tax=Desulforamulus ferrireducens TaxID=1833852 RepID=A0A1S6IVQ4_9FIRM|nr:hypothetical protein B0537_06910 [Desulforamulus ferrireducens]
MRGLARSDWGSLQGFILDSLRRLRCHLPKGRSKKANGQEPKAKGQKPMAYGLWPKAQKPKADG